MENNTRKQIFYRGLLKSCNYSCTYCPFSRHFSKRELEEDAVGLERFVKAVEQMTGVGAVLVTPYGEALIHEYYWKAMAALSRLPWVELVGCQTNLSFPVEHMLDVFQKAGGNRKKLRLWCTFHPTMVSSESFLAQCTLLERKHVAFCVGSVGVPGHREILIQLRERLPEAVYMWVNPIDGLKRKYTKEEIAGFAKIDPFFPYLLKRTKAQWAQCKGCLGEAMFVHFNGDVTACNLSRKKLGNLYRSRDFATAATTVEGSNCGSRECSCYLAYSNRLDQPELACFGKYPAFRMGQIPQAMFLDVDGTLVKEGCEGVDDKIAGQLAYWSQYTEIYLATSLHLAHAMKKCHAVKPFLSGGVFANGGIISLFQEKKTWIIAIEQEILQLLLQIFQSFPIHVRTYRQEGKVYKITAIGERSTEVYDILQKEVSAWGKESAVTIVLEGKHIEITGCGADKLAGVQQICEYCGYHRDKILVAGDSENDRPMLEYFAMAVKRHG